MANIWRKDDNVKEQPKRNIMDLSFQNNLTTQFGKLVPVFCKEFIPGDSFSIQPTFSLKFQPMVFPIQTRMRAYLHFFKVRNRNLWKDWEDFIAKNKENLDPPYLDTAVTEPITGSLLDYLGVPTTLVGDYGNVIESYVVEPSDERSYYGIANFVNQQIPSAPSELVVQSVTGLFSTLLNSIGETLTIGRIATPSRTSLSTLPITDYIDKANKTDLSISFSLNDNSVDISSLPAESVAIGETGSSDYVSPIPRESAQLGSFFKLLLLDSENTLLKIIEPNISDNSLLFSVENEEFASAYLAFPSEVAYYYATGSEGAYSNQQVKLKSPYTYKKTISVSVASSSLRDIDETTSPYWRSGSTSDLRERIKLSALPCRAYEQIYNSFYRNAENNPYILNGVPEYNKYMPTDEGGVDANLYDFYYRNWEDDFLTTALQQPQAGIAPLVGLTGTAGTATVTLADEDGNVSEATAQYDEDGNVLSVTSATNTSLTEALADAVTYGISINDLRNVNAFQRWLEAKARGGYKYRDVIETMFGITVRYDTLDMPEFIGGTSVDIMVNQISQTVPTETSPLGDYAGQASGIGVGNEINEYFDEHGFVIGILSVVPVPNYSQLLPKHFIKRDAFDYYFPQFGHIGMQPIKYNEVCPIQAYQDSTADNNVLDETFGYQRAWYDYLASTDEVHGEFRTNLRNFVMNRTFDVKPELVNSFLTVDPSQLNDVFAIQDDSYDKIMGQIFFRVRAKRPIPLYGIPKLE